MLLLYQPGIDPTRVYEGTDTRAFGLLIGAMLALAWPSGGKRGVHSAPPRKLPRIAAGRRGFAGLAGIGLMIWRVGEYSAVRLRRRASSCCRSRPSASWRRPPIRAASSALALGWRPLRWIGVRSYGIYLWHFPVIVMTTPANTKPSLPLAGLQIAASILLAALSWQLIEEPIRHGAIGRAWVKLRAGRPAAHAA